MTPAAIRRFRAKCESVPGSACVEWVGAVNSGGYGVLKFPGLTRSGVARAHRVGYWLHHSVVPDADTDLHHTCRNRRCVNGAHLEPVDHIEHAAESAQHRWHVSQEDFIF